MVKIIYQSTKYKLYLIYWSPNLTGKIYKNRRSHFTVTYTVLPVESWKPYYLKTNLNFQVTIIYLTTRLFTNLSQVYIPLYLQVIIYPSTKLLKTSFNIAVTFQVYLIIELRFKNVGWLNVKAGLWIAYSKFCKCVSWISIKEDKVHMTISLMSNVRIYLQQ